MQQAATAPLPGPSTAVAARRGGSAGDAIFEQACRLAGILVLVLLGAIIAGLFIGGLPAFRTFGLGFLTGTDWDPVGDVYGAGVSIYGTIITSVLALIMAVPLAFGVAFFLTELAPPWVRRPVGTAIELLAAVPSIIYGMWGFAVIVPFMADVVEPPLIDTFGDWPLIGPLFSGAPFGTGILTASLILAIMILPFIAATMRDVFATVPAVYKESAYGLGCTTWEVVRSVVLPYTRASVVGGIMLGLGRALGETMAVTFVIGNANRISTSLLAGGNTIASLIALEFPESRMGSLKLASLLALGFLLFVISFIVLAISRLLLRPRAAGAKTLGAAPGAPAPGARDPQRVGAAPAAAAPSSGGHRAAPAHAASAARSGLGPQKDQRIAASLGRRRKTVDIVVRLLCYGATALGLFLLVSILFTLAWRGFTAMSPTVFTEVTKPAGSNGGLLNAIVGSLIQTAVGTVVGTPIGMLVGTYLAEYARGSKLGAAVRFVSDVLLSAPSILIGLFVYQLLVMPFGGFSGWAGCVALAVIVIPIVVRTTEDMLRLIPNTLREAVMGLGSPKWKMITLICWRAAASGIITGILLAVARIAGETAPLLFTSLGNLNWSVNLSGPIASLPVTIYAYAGSAYADQVALAWAGALIITLSVLALNIVARTLLRSRS